MIVNFVVHVDVKTIIERVHGELGCSFNNVYEK